MERVGVIMKPQVGSPQEAGGVLNPGATVDRDGNVILLPRIATTENQSRIALCQLKFDASGQPLRVDRLGIALSPTEPWEYNQLTEGGVEDPRVTFVSALGSNGLYVMMYSAYGPGGPRGAMAVSEDAHHWERVGPVSFSYQPSVGTDLNAYNNKDMAVFPVPVLAPDDTPSIAFMHRPMWQTPSGVLAPAGLTDTRNGEWISFAPVTNDPSKLLQLSQHRLVALPLAPPTENHYESMHIGWGAPPVLIDLRSRAIIDPIPPEISKALLDRQRASRFGWLCIDHGVALHPNDGDGPLSRCYSAGAKLLAGADATKVLARTHNPLQRPETSDEIVAIPGPGIGNVVFPTGIVTLRTGKTMVFSGLADSYVGASVLSSST